MIDVFRRKAGGVHVCGGHPGESPGYPGGVIRLLHCYSLEPHTSTVLYVMSILSLYILYNIIIT